MFCRFEVPNMSRFTRFSRGKIWFGNIVPCKRFDIFQLCLFIVTRFINVSMSLPKTSYVKMVDVWLLFTLLIPFLEVGQISNIIVSCKKSWIQVTNIRSRCSSKHISSTYGVNLKTRKRWTTMVRNWLDLSSTTKSSIY